MSATRVRKESASTVIQIIILKIKREKEFNQKIINELDRLIQIKMETLKNELGISNEISQIQFLENLIDTIKVKFNFSPEFINSAQNTDLSENVYNYLDQQIQQMYRKLVMMRHENFTYFTLLHLSMALEQGYISFGEQWDHSTPYTREFMTSAWILQSIHHTESLLTTSSLMCDANPLIESKSVDAALSSLNPSHQHVLSVTNTLKTQLAQLKNTCETTISKNKTQLTYPAHSVDKSKEEVSLFTPLSLKELPTTLIKDTLFIQFLTEITHIDKELPLEGQMRLFYRAVQKWRNVMMQKKLNFQDNLSILKEEIVEYSFKKLVAEWEYKAQALDDQLIWDRLEKLTQKFVRDLAELDGDFKYLQEINRILANGVSILKTPVKRDVFFERLDLTEKNIIETLVTKFKNGLTAMSKKRQMKWRPIYPTINKEVLEKISNLCKLLSDIPKSITIHESIRLIVFIKKITHSPKSLEEIAETFEFNTSGVRDTAAKLMQIYCTGENQEKSLNLYLDMMGQLAIANSIDERIVYLRRIIFSKLLEKLTEYFDKNELQRTRDPLREEKPLKETDPLIDLLGILRLFTQLRSKMKDKQINMLFSHENIEMLRFGQKSLILGLRLNPENQSFLFLVNHFTDHMKTMIYPFSRNSVPEYNTSKTLLFKPPTPPHCLPQKITRSKATFFYEPPPTSTVRLPAHTLELSFLP